jgi:hypothetical protein
VGIPLQDLEGRIAGSALLANRIRRDKERTGPLIVSGGPIFIHFIGREPSNNDSGGDGGRNPGRGFGAGGVPEMVEDEQNGWLCAPGDQRGLIENYVLPYHAKTLRNLGWLRSNQFENYLALNPLSHDTWRYTKE